MKEDRITSVDAESLVYEYTNYLTKSNPNHSTILNESKNLVLKSRQDTIRFMEKIMLNHQTNPTRKTKSFLINSIPSPSPIPSQRKYMSIEININKSSHRNKSPKKLLFPSITQHYHKKNQLSQQQNNKPIKIIVLKEQIPKNENNKERTQENSNQKSTFKKIKSRHMISSRHVVKFETSDKEFEIKDENTKSHLFRSNNKEISTTKIVNVDEINSKVIRSKNKRMNTISFNPYFKQLHETIKEDREESIIVDHIVISASYIDKSIREMNFIFNMDRILNVKSYSIYALFEGQGEQGAFLSSYIKNMFASIMTQALTYEFKSTYINSRTVYSSLINNDYEILKGVMERVNDLATSTNIDLKNNSYSFAAVLIIGDKVITISQGDTKAILIKKNIERDVERFTPVTLSTDKEDKNKLHICHNYITDDVINLVIGSKMIWDDNTRPYANILKVLSSTKIDIKEKCDMIIKFKKKQSATWGEMYDLSFVIIDFEQKKEDK